MTQSRYGTSALRAAVAIGMPFVLASAVHAHTLIVGPGQAFSTVAAAVAAAADGDTVAVMAGTYLNDYPEINSKIALTAVGGRVTLRSNAFIPNEKGILLTNTDATVTGFSFIGAFVTEADGANGAGLRYQGGKLVLNDCYFANNQEGLLANPDLTGSITINRSEFRHNGVSNPASQGYGRTHNIYVNEIALLDIENSYSHDANIGHEIKSRALQTIVRNSRVADGPTGTSSYSIDLPNGGVGLIVGNRIGQGPLGQNPGIIAFGEEGSVFAGSSLAVDDNLIENDLSSQYALAVWNAAGTPTTLRNNKVYGLTSSQILQGVGTAVFTSFLTSEPWISTSHPWGP